MITLSKQLGDASFITDANKNVSHIGAGGTGWGAGSQNSISLATEYGSYLATNHSVRDVSLGWSPPYHNPLGNETTENIFVAGRILGVYVNHLGDGAVRNNIVFSDSALIQTAVGETASIRRNKVFGAGILHADTGATQPIQDNYIVGIGSIVSNSVDNTNQVRHNMIFSAFGTAENTSIINSDENAILHSRNVSIEQNSYNNIVIGVTGLTITNERHASPLIHMGQIALGRGTTGALPTTGGTKSLKYNPATGIVSSEDSQSTGTIIDASNNWYKNIGVLPSKAGAVSNTAISNVINNNYIDIAYSQGSTLMGAGIGVTGKSGNLAKNNILIGYQSYINGSNVANGETSHNIILGHAHNIVGPNPSFGLDPIDHSMIIGGQTNNILSGLRANIIGGINNVIDKFIAGTQTDVLILNGNGNIIGGDDDGEQLALINTKDTYLTQGSYMTVIGTTGLNLTSSIPNTVFMPKLRIGQGTNGALPTSGATRMMGFDPVTGIVSSELLPAVDPAGTTFQIQFNQSNNFAADADLTWQPTTKTFAVGNIDAVLPTAASRNNSLLSNHLIDASLGAFYFRVSGYYNTSLSNYAYVDAQSITIAGEHNTVISSSANTISSFAQIGTYFSTVIASKDSRLSSSTRGIILSAEDCQLSGSTNSAIIGVQGFNLYTSTNTTAMAKLILGRGTGGALPLSGGTRMLGYNPATGVVSSEVIPSGGSGAFETDVNSNTDLSTIANTLTGSVDSFVWNNISGTYANLDGAAVLASTAASISGVGTLYNSLIMGDAHTVTLPNSLHGSAIVGGSGNYLGAYGGGDSFRFTIVGGFDSRIQAYGADNAILSSNSAHILGTSNNVVIVGGVGIVANSQSNAVFMPKLKIGLGTGGALPTTNATRMLGYDESDGSVVSLLLPPTGTIVFSKDVVDNDDYLDKPGKFPVPTASSAPAVPWDCVIRKATIDFLSSNVTASGNVRIDVRNETTNATMNITFTVTGDQSYRGTYTMLGISIPCTAGDFISVKVTKINGLIADITDMTITLIAGLE